MLTKTTMAEAMKVDPNPAFLSASCQWSRGGS